MPVHNVGFQGEETRFNNTASDEVTGIRMFARRRWCARTS